MSNTITFQSPQKVTVTGYSDDLMEPFISRDGTILLFNNSNDPSVDTNLHWAAKVNETTFEYKGQVAGVNTTSLEGVPTLDNNGNLYFVSLRDYSQTLASVFKVNFSSGVATNLAQVAGVSKDEAGWVNFDVEVNSTGEQLYLADGRYDQAGGPYEADIFIAQKMDNGFKRMPNSAELLKNINTGALEYAACISENNLELYFTRVEAPLSSSSVTQIFMATRNNVSEPFGLSSKVDAITGFVEAPTISRDGNLYYHKRDDSGRYSLYLAMRVN